MHVFHKTNSNLINLVMDYQMPGDCRAFKTKFIIFGQLNQNVSYSFTVGGRVVKQYFWLDKGGRTIFSKFQGSEMLDSPFPSRLQSTTKVLKIFFESTPNIDYIKKFSTRWYTKSQCCNVEREKFTTSIIRQTQGNSYQHIQWISLYIKK